MPEGGNHEGAVNSVLAKVDTEAGREVVRAIPPEHVRSARHSSTRRWISSGPTRWCEP